MYVCNKRVGCTPFPQMGMEVEVKKGFATGKSKATLVPLTVVVQDDEWKYHPGATVWVLGDCMKLLWAVEKFEVEGQSFILVPVDRVVLHKPLIPTTQLGTDPQWTITPSIRFYGQP